MKRCPKCNRAFTDSSMRFCLEDGEVLVDAAASLSHDSQATLVLPAAHGSGPSGFSTTQMDRSGGEHLVTPDFSQRRQSAHRLPVMQNRNYTAWVFVALVILGLAGIVGYFLLRSRESDGSRNAQTVTTTSETSSSTPPMSTTPQRETSDLVDKQPNANSLSSPLAPAKGAPEQNALPSIQPEEVSRSDRRPGPESTQIAPPSNQNQGQGERSISNRGSYGIVIENEWVVYSPNKTFGVCFVSFSEEEKVVFVRFTISASRSTLPETRSTDFMLVADQNRRFDPACGSASFNPAVAEPKTITLAYKVPRDLRSATFRFHRTGYGEPITFGLTNLQ